MKMKICENGDPDDLGDDSLIPPFGESRWSKMYPAYLPEKIWLSADSKITSSARSALATRPNRLATQSEAQNAK